MRRQIGVGAPASEKWLFSEGHKRAMQLHLPPPHLFTAAGTL
jgi:hypothetical protein